MVARLLGRVLNHFLQGVGGRNVAFLEIFQGKRTPASRQLMQVEMSVDAS